MTGHQPGVEVEWVVGRDPRPTEPAGVVHQVRVAVGNCPTDGVDILRMGRRIEIAPPGGVVRRNRFAGLSVSLDRPGLRKEAEPGQWEGRDRLARWRTGPDPERPVERRRGLVGHKAGGVPPLPGRRLCLGKHGGDV